MPVSHLIAGGLQLTCVDAVITLRDAATGGRLLVAPLAGCGVPWLGDARVEPTSVSIAQLDDRLRVLWTGPGIDHAVTEFVIGPDGFELSASFCASADCELTRYDLFPPGTALNLLDVVNFRNRHHTHRTWPELPLGGAGCTTDTGSTDWQFAPHPTMMVLRGPDAQLLVGAIDLTTAYGMHLAVERLRVRHWHLDHGGPGHGQQLRAGETVTAPRIGLRLERSAEVHDTVRRWALALARRGLIADPADRVRHAWHTAPLYCTWIDQCARAAFDPPPELREQAACAAPPIRALSADLVREAVAVIRRERLPFRTILIDDGWQVARGQWEAHPERFPDFRGLVDELHAAGFKVLVWWGWPEIERDAVVDPRFLVGGGRLNRHGARVWDFSSPVTRSEYLEPLFQRLMADGPGCYDLDGVKTDFIADKIHADMAPADPAWRGEENHFVRFHRLFHGLMRQHKPDAMHLGCSGHPWLAEFIDANRTFDVWTSDVREHEGRGRMLEATCPGSPVSLDFHVFVERYAEWFALARRRGWAVEVGGVMGMKRDMLADWEPADAAFHALLRDGLGMDGGRPTST